MERMCVIALGTAVVLTVLVIPLDAWAISDWRTNAVDTAATVSTIIVVAAWLFTAMAWLQLGMRDYIEAVVARAKAKRREDAESAEGTIRRLVLDQPTQPLTVPLTELSRPHRAK